MSQFPGFDRVERLTQGDDYDVDITFSRVPTGQRIVKAWLTVKQNPADADNAALIQIPITTIADANNNQITDDGALTGRNGFGKAKLHWTILASIVASLPAGPDLPFDVQVRSSAGRTATVDRGVFRIHQQITQATS